MHSSLEHIDACLPITALKVLDVDETRFILQGQGLYCRLIDEDSGKLLAELKTFKRNNVHGFSIFSQERGRVQLLAWGGQSVRAIDLFYSSNAVTGHPDTLLSATSTEFLAPDWILAGCASSFDNTGGCAYLVTAHNALIGLRVVDGDLSSKYKKTIHLQQLATGVKSILYSAHTVQISSSHVLIAAGTVFGEIIVWSCFMKDLKSLASIATSSIHHFFTGHDGSIFGVEISPALPNLMGTGSGRLLASCSDDRTIRIWDISHCERASPQDPSAYSTDGFELRSTGFGAVRELGSESCTTKAFGHTARIWGIHFMPATTDQGKIRLVSRGEDAQCLLWDLTWDPSSTHTPEMQLREVSSFHYHTGKHIFSLSMCLINGGIVVYTGGNDGAIKTFKVDENTKESGEIFHEIGAAIALSNSRDIKGRKGNAPLKTFDFVTSDCYIGTSASGEVQLGWVGPKNLAEHGMQPQITKETVCVEDDLRGYSAISSLSHRGLAFVGNSQGLIRFYSHQSKSLINVAQTDQRPLGLFALDPDPDRLPGSLDTVSFVASYVATDRANLFTVSVKESLEPHVQNIPLRLLYPSEVQCASFFHGGHYLALGFWNGALAVYRVPDSKDNSEEFLRPLTSVRAVHGEDGINQITPFLSQTRDDGLSVDYLLTCGRDGNYCVHEVSTGPTNNSFHLQTIHRSSPAANQNIEGIYFDKTSNDLMLYGFRGMDFVLWNESTQSEVAKFFCGGARRIWAFHPSQEKSGDGLFLWHQSGFNCRRIHSDSTRPVRAGGHGREVKSMEVFNPSGNEGRMVFATGAEDTTVRLFEPIQPGTENLWGALKCLRVLRKHRTGLQQVGWSNNGHFLFTSAGYEEFFAWRVRWIPRFGIATLLIGVTPKEDPSSECRVTSFDTLTVEEQGGQYGFLIVLTFPNSVIKLFHYSPSINDGNFTLLAKGTYMSNCLTQARFIQKQSSMGLITTSTDGHFTFWNLTSVLEPFYGLSSPNTLTIKQPLTATSTTMTPAVISCESRYQIHSNSIKSLELAHVSETASLVIAGGDDNALTLSLLDVLVSHPDSDSLPESNAHVQVHTVSIPDAHAASVTTVKIVEQSGPHVNTNGNAMTDLVVASSGNDHRVKVWSVRVDNTKSGPDAISVQNLIDHYSPVADISSLDVIQGADRELKLLVCGVGMELVRAK